MAGNDFGIKVSLPGFDVENAADIDLYFSSSWPTLKIDDALSGTLTLTGNPSLDLVTHDLGYPPFTMVWSHANGFYPYYISSINLQTVVFGGTNVQFNIGDKIRYYIFRNPLNINFQAQDVQIAQTQQGTNHQDFGIKLTKPGKNTDSTDLRDYTIHSGTKSLQVHQVVYQPLGQFSDTVFGLPNNPNNVGLKYITDLLYRPVYFAFYSKDGQNFVPVFAAAQTNPKVVYGTIDGGLIIFNGTNPGGFGVFYVLLDPYYSTNQVSVTL